MPNPNELAPLTVTPGALRFNTDSMKLEYYRGGPVGFGTTTQTGEWVNLTTDSPDIQTGGARGVFAGGDPGSAPSLVNVMDYINISSTGNAIDFGDLTGTRTILGACSSSTRGLFAGGYYNGVTDSNVIDYITISSTGNAQDFGDLTQFRRGACGCSSSTRGIFIGGLTTTAPLAPITFFNIIDYVTIASTGNAVDFGDATTIRAGVDGACSSSTRGIIAGGQTPSNINVIDYVTIASTGNAADFGDLTQARGGPAAASNSVRGIWGGGYAPTIQNVIDFITISTTGNASDFGDLTAAKATCGSCSSSTRGVFGGGSTPTIINVIEYVTIMSVGNAIDFGDLTGGRQRGPALSNGHGGLG